ncbi:hypothetical protein NYE67_05460 [Solibacillus sp. FSL W8-0474]|uniref:acyltransferase family protein n=1 Tax=Solibacillus sp. FSL W8-0474 TaxID=2975336 RepID=UPI0030F92121
MSIQSNIFVTMFFGIFYLLINKKLRFLNTSPLIFLGTISYSFYLVHQNIGYIIIFNLEKYGFNSEFFLIIPLAGSIILATLITYFIEKPIQKFVSNKSKNIKRIEQISAKKVSRQLKNS